MAVYTHITASELSELLSDFDLGQLKCFEGIDGGIENTNYFVDLEHEGKLGRYVLTIFEELNDEELPFFVELLHWLSDRNVPVPFGFEDRNGIALKRILKKSGILQPRFEGRILPKEELTPDHCAQIGTALAELHIAGQDFYLKRQAHRGIFWWRQESGRVLSKLSEDEAALLTNEVQNFEDLRNNHADEMPTGIIHGDLFLDNALFVGDKLSAILDLYNAATAYLLFDLAIVANDWCTNPDGTIDQAREAALLSAYNAKRPFVDIEHKAWPILTRTAAMRFWLSRLLPWHGLEGEDSNKKLKDPDELKAILINRIESPAKLPSA
ncbi:MAG: homoserine kinase [Pontibacterium sp.]